MCNCACACVCKHSIVWRDFIFVDYERNFNRGVINYIPVDRGDGKECDTHNIIWTEDAELHSFDGPKRSLAVERRHLGGAHTKAARIVRYGPHETIPNAICVITAALCNGKRAARRTRKHTNQRIVRYRLLLKP